MTIGRWECDESPYIVQHARDLLLLGIVIDHLLDLRLRLQHYLMIMSRLIVALHGKHLVA